MKWNWPLIAGVRQLCPGCQEGSTWLFTPNPEMYVLSGRGKSGLRMFRNSFLRGRYMNLLELK